MLPGEIPADLGNCENLIWLDLRSNLLTGPMPGALAAQTGLIARGIVSDERLALLRKEGGGSACPSLQYYLNTRGSDQRGSQIFAPPRSCSSSRITSHGIMVYLDLSYNSLDGLIPAQLGKMDYLLMLNLQHNQ